MNYEFRFPQDIDRFEIIESLQHLKQILASENQYKQYKLHYKNHLRKDRYIYSRCHKCDAKLTFRRVNGDAHFHLVSFKNLHNHQIKHNIFNLSLINFIKELPNSLQIKTAKALVKNSLPGTSDSKFYYFFRKVKNPHMQYKQLISKLDQEYYQIQSRPYEYQMNELPELLLLVSPDMKNMFNKYGTFLGFDLTFHTIKQRKDNKIYKLGAFLGLSASRKIVPFGLVVMIDQTKQSFYELFKSFGDIMKKQPDYLITDQSTGIISAVKQLQQDREFDGHHVFDSFHICRNVKKKLQKKQNLKYFVQLLKAKHQIEYQQELSHAYNCIESESDIKVLQSFDQSRRSTCLSQLPIKGIIGFSCSNSINQKFHDMLKTRIAKELPFTKTVQIALQLMKEMLQKCDHYQIEKQPIQKYYFSELKEVRYRTDKRVFQDLCLQLPKIIKLEIKNIYEDRIQMFDQDLRWDIVIQRINNNLICPCKYNVRIGIPCFHLIKACIYLKYSIISLFHPRWLLQSPSNQQKIKRNSTGKVSRRNRR